MLRTMAQRRAGTGARAGGVLLAGTLAANILSYAFFAVLGRSLDTTELGAVGSVVNLSVLAAVPLLGLQLVAARLVSRGRISTDAHGPEAQHVARGVVGPALSLGCVVAGVVAVLSPLLARMLHLDVPTLLVVALMMVPTAVVYAAQGVLQGLEQFGRLATVLAAAGVAKLVAAVGTALARGSVTLVVTLLAAGWVLVCVLALALLPPSSRRGRGTRVPHLPRLVASAVVPTSGLLFLSSVDVLLARHHLSGPASGAYTVGALFEKAAFWGLGFLATLHYPAMAQAQRRRGALVRALGMTAAAGAVGVAVTAAFGRQLVTIVGGPAYAAMGPVVWRFAALGVCLALVQVLAYAGLARAATPMGIALWLAGASVVGLTAVRHGGVTEVVDVMLGVAAVLVVAGLVIERRSFAAPAGTVRPHGEAADRDTVVP